MLSDIEGDKHVMWVFILLPCIKPHVSHGSIINRSFFKKKSIEKGKKEEQKKTQCSNMDSTPLN